MTPRLLLVALLGPLVAALALVPARVARADAEELALQLEAGTAFLQLENSLENGATTTKLAPRLTMRSTYGLSNTFALVVGVGGLFANAVHHPDQMTPQGTGTIHADFRAVGATAGVTARLGAQIVPTFSAAVGYQHRWLTGGALLSPDEKAFAFFPDTQYDDLTVTGGIGLEVRINRHWMVGGSVQLTHAIPIGGGAAFGAIEIPLYVPYYFYPGWFRENGTFLPGGTPLRWDRDR